MIKSMVHEIRDFDASKDAKYLKDGSFVITKDVQKRLGKNTQVVFYIFETMHERVHAFGLFWDKAKANVFAKVMNDIQIEKQKYWKV
jgi:hypothetical protein